MQGSHPSILLFFSDDFFCKWLANLVCREISVILVSDLLFILELSKEIEYHHKFQHLCRFFLIKALALYELNKILYIYIYLLINCCEFAYFIKSILKLIYKIILLNFQ